MKMLFMAGREPTYVRNALMLKCLEQIGVGILDCSDSRPGYPGRLLAVLRKFAARKKEAFDAVFVGFFGQPLVPVVWHSTDRPIILDAFLSGYDTICFERKIFRPGSPVGRFFRWLDRYACEKSALVLLDTNAQIDYFTRTFALPREKFRRVLVGADESIFFPRPVDKSDGKFRIFYCCSFLPLHGARYVVEAAAALAGHLELEFLVAGRGPELGRVRALARDRRADNIRFLDWLPYGELPAEIAKADICLGGHFSDFDKAKRVIAGKSFQFIAMKKPVIVGDCPGNRELFCDRSNALFVRMADAGALAGAILELRGDANLRGRIADAGYQTFLTRCCTGVLAQELRSIIPLAVPSGA